jgi:hypothetical protein
MFVFARKIDHNIGTGNEELLGVRRTYALDYYLGP